MFHENLFPKDTIFIEFLNNYFDKVVKADEESLRFHVYKKEYNSSEFDYVGIIDLSYVSVSAIPSSVLDVDNHVEKLNVRFKVKLISEKYILNYPNRDTNLASILLDSTSMKILSCKFSGELNNLNKNDMVSPSVQEYFNLIVNDVFKMEFDGFMDISKLDSELTSNLYYKKGLKRYKTVITYKEIPSDFDFNIVEFNIKVYIEKNIAVEIFKSIINYSLDTVKDSLIKTKEYLNEVLEGYKDFNVMNFVDLDNSDTLLSIVAKDNLVFLNEGDYSFKLYPKENLSLNGLCLEKNSEYLFKVKNDKIVETIRLN